MISCLARRRFGFSSCTPYRIFLRHTYSSFALTEPKKTDQQHKQRIIEKKKADIDEFIKQGLVKKATDLIKSGNTDVKYIKEQDDPFYRVPSPSSAADGEEREYILLDEGKRKRRKKGEWEEEIEAIAKGKEKTKNNSEFSHCYADWCAFYRPIFEQAPYSLGFQQPDENGQYSWSFALETANKMVFGNETFRPLQLEALNASLRGEDVFLSLPTGGGKSLCFWLRALLSPGAVVVVSPLVALMHDQIQKLSSRGIPVLKLDSATKATAMKALRKEDLTYKLIYLTPERMRSNEFLEIFRNLYSKDLISMVAIDEAHCISEWGHDFRPSYRRLGIFREEFPNIPIMAMTATATLQVQKDILKSLHIEDTATVFESSFNRPNIYYEVRPKVMVTDDIAHFISSEKYSKASGLIYCLTKNDAQELADELRIRGIHASPYHSSMPATMRSQIQDAWKDGSIKVLCTTTAFGLGVDKADLRYVIHHTVPLSLEAYYQQTGRAGRDGLDSTCILYYAQSDFIRATKMLAAVNSNNPDAPIADDSELLFESGGHMGVKVDLMDNVITFCSEEKKCRREILLAYFGEKIHRSACNHKCDNCQRLLASKTQPHSHKPQLHSLSSLSPSPPTPRFAPPPHISHPPQHSRPTSQEATEENEEKEEEEEEEDEKEQEEQEEKLSPLERLRRRRIAKKEFLQTKLLHPNKGITPAIFYDKVSKARSKRARDKVDLRESLKSEREKRVEKMRQTAFNPDHECADEKVSGINNLNRYTKLRAKTGKVIEDSPARSFGNSLRNAPKEKLNKTGKIKSNDSEDADGATTRNKPKHILSVIRKHNSLQFKSMKLNKTGKVDTEKNAAENDSKPASKFGNSLQYPKEKLNKTGKITVEEEPKRTNKLQPKLNKTGKINGDHDEEITRTPVHRQKIKPNKTGRLVSKKSVNNQPFRSPTSSSSTSTTNSQMNLLSNEKVPLREYLTKLQANSIANSSASFGPGSASAALPVPKAAVASLSSLRQVYQEIAREGKGSTNVGEGKGNEFFSEGVLLKIWNTKPTSILELTSIPGVGSHNATKYADKILPLFRK